jgi:large subunit ribosomal protein L31
MKSNIHPKNDLVKFSCISCNQEFEVYSTHAKESLKMDVCGNCHTFYTGRSSSDVKTGKIEVFNQRERKTKEKNNPIVSA